MIVPWYHGRILESLDSETASTLDEQGMVDLVLSLLRQLETAPEAPPISGAHNQLAVRLVDEMRGLGPLGPLLRDADVSDILVNGLSSVMWSGAGA